MKEVLTPKIESERINLLFHSAQMATNGVLLGYFMLLLAFKDIVALTHLIIWSVIFFIIIFLRILTLLYIKHKNSIEPISLKYLQRYELLYSALSFLTGLVFSATLFIPFDDNKLVTTMFTAMVLMGLAAGSAVSSNASIKVVTVFLFVTTLPLIIHAFQQAEKYYYLIAFSYTFFSLILMKITLMGNNVVVENLHLKAKSRSESLKDQLTGLWNRRSLELFIEKLIPNSIRNKKTFSIVLLDIDFFKKYNDKYGHLKGDEALVNVANTLLNELRENDLAVRFGGEEFLIVLPETNIDRAKKITQRIIDRIESNTENTISAGIAVYSEKMKFEALVKIADDALYIAKENGRNQFAINS